MSRLRVQMVEIHGHHQLLCQSQVLWLSEGKVLCQLFKLEEEVMLFFWENKALSALWLLLWQHI